MPGACSQQESGTGRGTGLRPGHGHEEVGLVVASRTNIGVAIETIWFIYPRPFDTDPDPDSDPDLN